MTLRAAGKLGWFLFQVLGNCLLYLASTAFVSAGKKPHARASWLNYCARRHLKIFGCIPEVIGEIPRRGLLVSNHLSYFDIIVIGSITPAVFVSKADVRRWPLFGFLTRIAGTVYIERERRSHVGAVNQEIESALAAGLLVVVFPEGTSSNGETVLPFRSSLLEPALRGGHEIHVSRLHYELASGDARQEVCYWGDHSFFPHLLTLLGNKSVRATLRFGSFSRTTDDRKELAAQLHAAVLELRN
jgi:1-acyl-sn-glycerol-3-phosphate acyltransferase